MVFCKNEVRNFAPNINRRKALKTIIKMKKVLLTTLLLIAGATATMFAQDVIHLKSNKVINAYDVKFVGKYITYKKADDDSGRSSRILQDLICKIVYEDGEEDIIDPDCDDLEEDEPVPAPRRQTTSTTPVRRPATQSSQRPTTSSGNRDAGTARRQQPTTVNRRPAVARPADDYAPAADYEQPFRRNTVGLNIGVASLFEEIDGLESAGLHFALQYGLFFTRNMGMNFQFFGNNYSSSSSYSDWGVQHDGLLLGPLMAIPLSRTRKAELFLKPAIGVGWANALDDGSIKGDSFGFGLALGMGGAFRFNLGTRFALSVDLDIYYGSVDDSNEYVKVYDSKFTSAAFSVGAYYRF
jgi:hypothetical protein